MKPIWYVVLGVALSFGALYLWHRYRAPSNKASEVVEISIDTLIYRGVLPDSISSLPTTKGDSLDIYHFSDSIDGRWSAEIAGHNVELRSLVLRESYESRTTTLNTPPSWEVSAVGCISPYSRWVGVGVERNIGRFKLSLGAGYDPVGGAPHVEGSIGVVLWREY